MAIKLLCLSVVVAVFACNPGRMHGLGAACSNERPCRSFLRCSSSGTCEALDHSDAAVDALVDGPFAVPSDASDDGRSFSDAPDTRPDAAMGANPDAQVEAGRGRVCEFDASVPPAAPVRLPPVIACTDKLEHCSIERGVAGWPSNDVPVCILPTAGQFPDRAVVEGVRKLVRQTWSRWVPVRFSGWSNCDCAPPGVIGLTLPEGAAVASLAGYSRDGTVSMTIGLQAATSIDDVALAFGRALGVIDRTHSGAVTTREVLRAQRTYGLKPARSLVSSEGGCLANKDGTAVVAECQAIPEQAWEPNSRGDIANLNAAAPNSCLTPVQSVSGSPLVALETCYPGPPGQAQLRAMQWRALGNLCVRSMSATPGARMSVDSCREGDPLGQWDFLSGANTIQLTGTSLCVTAASGYDVGAPLTLQPCGVGATVQGQRFTFHRGEILVSNGHCFNVWGGQPIEGQLLQLWDWCGDEVFGDNMIFFASGQLMLDDKCLGAPDETSQNAAAVPLPCSWSPRTTWDYHW